MKTVDNQTFLVTNRCYNGELYPCQCLELGYLIRHQPGYNPNTLYSLNNVSAPTCPEEPSCSKLKSATTPSLETSTETPAGDHPCVVSSPCHPEALCTATGDPVLTKTTFPILFTSRGHGLQLRVSGQQHGDWSGPLRPQQHRRGL